jgi:CBS domain-containing protein
VALAKDVMTAKPIVLLSSTTITEAVDTFTKHKFSSVAVVTSMGEIAGQLTELVLVRAIVLSQLQPEKFRQLVHCTDLLEPAFAVEPGDSIATVIKTLMRSPSRRVLVLNSGRKIIGIISPKDLMRVLTSGESEAQSLKTEIGKLGEGKVDPDKAGA